jgi:POT family proton-dependent oligopeptide transporter
METHGIPNDLIKSSNPVAYVIIGVLVQKKLYPFLQRRKISFSPVNRISLGFFIMSVAMAYSAVVQAIIYRSGPCYSHPLSCPASSRGRTPSHVHVLLQLPMFGIIALAEVFLLADWIRVHILTCPEEHEVSSAGMLHRYRGSRVSVGNGFVASG